MIFLPSEPEDEGWSSHLWKMIWFSFAQFSELVQGPSKVVMPQYSDYKECAFRIYI